MARKGIKNVVLKFIGASFIVYLFLFGHTIMMVHKEYNTVEQKPALITRRETMIQAKPKMKEPIAGYFNQFTVSYKSFKEGFHSNAHCIGDNFGEDSWKYRSCHFQNLCFDTDTREYVMFASPETQSLNDAMMNPQLTFFHPASDMKNTSVSLGGLNPKWGEEHKLMEWYPKFRDIADLKTQGGYYQLGADKVLIPWYSMTGFNPGHLVWDDFLPIYTLLSAFDLVEKDLVLMRIDVSIAMWASCQRKWDLCEPMLKKFLPLLGTELSKTSTQNDVSFELVKKGARNSKYICAPHAAAGMGYLTDHGKKHHGWFKKDYNDAYNSGRGGQIYQFRNWMIDHLFDGNLPNEKISKEPYRIVFSNLSSGKAHRSVDFTKHSQLLERRLGSKYNLDIRTVRLSSMSLKDQVELTASASIFITTCGGGAVTSMFLPKGASVLLYFSDYKISDKPWVTDTEAKLDWDLLNNIGYLRAHWLPRAKIKFNPRSGEPSLKQSEIDLDALVKLVDSELDIISHLDDYE